MYVTVLKNGGGGGSSGSSGLYAPIEWISQQDDQYSIPLSYNQIKAAVESGGVATISSSFEDPQQEGATVTKFYHAASFTVGESGGVTAYAVQFAAIYGSDDLMFVALDPDNELVSPGLLQP